MCSGKKLNKQLTHPGENPESRGLAPASAAAARAQQRPGAARHGAAGVPVGLVAGRGVV